MYKKNLNIENNEKKNFMRRKTESRKSYKIGCDK